MKTTDIIMLGPEHKSLYRAHMKRHRSESGRNGFHFMPFAPDDPQGPSEIDYKRLQKPLADPGWQRTFIMLDTNGNIIAHLHLKGELLKTLSHRCWLELGVEKKYHRQGLGEALCRQAIGFARDMAGVDWIDLYTFAHNVPARTLYKKLGFREVGTSVDRFRIGDLSIDDVLMSLQLNSYL